MSQFLVYMDKENDSTAVGQSVKNSHHNIRAGKTFHDKAQLGQRRALGDVNINTENYNATIRDKTSEKVKEAIRKKEEFKLCENLDTKAQAVKDLQNDQTKLQENDEISENLTFNDEIEFMLPYDEEKEDDFEDIWPKLERPSSCIEKLKQWRPTISMFPKTTDSLDELDDYILLKDPEEPIRDYQFEEEDFENENAVEIEIEEFSFDMLKVDL